jgi:hypothetical protein
MNGVKRGGACFRKLPDDLTHVPISTSSWALDQTRMVWSEGGGVCFRKLPDGLTHALSISKRFLRRVLELKLREFIKKTFFNNSPEYLPIFIPPPPPNSSHSCLEIGKDLEPFFLGCSKLCGKIRMKGQLHALPPCCTKGPYFTAPSLMRRDRQSIRRAWTVHRL